MKKVFLGLGIFLIILAGYLYWRGKIEILNPLGNKKVLRQAQDELQVVGFLPTYMIGKTREYTNEIDELIFLGVEVDENGDLIWDYQGKKINNEIYLKQKELIWKNGGKNILGIKMFDDEKLDKFINSAKAQDNLIKQLKALRQAQGVNRFDGVNVDFEYQGNPMSVLSDDFISFLKKLKGNNLGEISLDVFANTVIKGSEVQLESLMSSIDNLIVMAYDFHRPGVDYVGPVAPIDSEVGKRNIMEIVDKILDLSLDKKKIIMAYPLYGYEWKTYSGEFGAAVKRGWYQMISWRNAKELMSDTAFVETSAVKWDELSMTPWITFEENGEIHQIYYENEKSLKIKLDLVRQNQLGGVGFWALGYEGENGNFWNNLRVDD